MCLGAAPSPWKKPVIDEVLEGLARLRTRDAGPLSPGLRPANARVCMDAAVDAITRTGLHSELSTPGQRPERVTLVCAYGVFTSPIEWAALLLAAGCLLLAAGRWLLRLAAGCCEFQSAAAAAAAHVHVHVHAHVHVYVYVYV